MEEQDVKMDSASAAPSPTIDKFYDQDQGMNHSPSEAIPDQNGEDNNPSPSPGAESGSESRAGSSDDEDDEDDEEGGEEHERVDETGAIVIEDDDDEDDADDTADEEQQVKNSVKIKPSPESNSIAISTLLNEAGHEQNKPKSKSKSADKSETPLAPPPSASAKPKSKSKVKPRSPSPVPAAAPPLQTVRLSIPLGGPDNYAVDISSLAKATGQRPPTPVQKKNNDSTDSEVEKAKDKEEEPKKKKKKNATSEYYDVTDPFIDDSELAVDDRKFFAQTKQQGFYVSSGEVALMKDRSPKKPKSKRFANTDAGPSSQHPRASVEGSRDAPIALMDEESDTTRPPASHVSENGAHKGDRKKNWLQKNPPGTKSGSPTAQHGTGLSAPLTGNLAAMRKLNWQDPDPDPDPGDGESEGYGDGGEKLGMKRKRITYTTVVDNGKKRKVVDIASFHPELQAAFARLRDAIAAENWEQKGKFPPSIKPVLAEVALRAVTLDEYGEHFFNLMPTLFPYNKFTMSKLIKRTIFADHTKLLVDRQDALLTELKRQADEGFPKAKEEWEKSVVAWKQRQNRQKGPDHRTSGGGEDSGSAVPTRHPSEDPENPNHERDGLEEDNYPIGSAGPAAQAVAEAVEKAEKAGGKDKEAQAPPKKYRLTENMKAIVWELVLLSNECCRLENEKNTLEGSVMQVSEQGLRKILYQKIVSAFPQGWISSGQISRDVSAMKKRLEKEREEEQEMDTPATAL